MNNDEFEQFVLDNGKEILNFCRMTCRDKESGDELYQDTMFKLLKMRNKLDCQQNVRSYALSISLLLWKNKKRKYANRNRLISFVSIDEMKDNDNFEIADTGSITPELHLIFLNLIYDLSCTAIPWDNVDEEFIAVPRKWDASSVGNFMIWIGPTSSIFDFTTYIFMYFVFCPMFVSHGVLFNDLANHFSGAELAQMQFRYAAMFQAGWFVESMWSQTLVIHMIRTPKIPFIQSRASAPLTLLTFTGITVLTIIPFTAFGAKLGFVALPGAYFAYLIPCILLYMALATSLKKAYVRHYGELL